MDSVDVALSVHVVRENDDVLQDVLAFYAAVGESPCIALGERLLVAHAGGSVVAAVRLASEKGVLVLRTLFVAPEVQHRGIGSALVRRLLALSTDDVYCIPFERAEPFYQRFGFARATTAPSFLMERAAGYLSDGHEVYTAVRPFGRS